MQGFSFFGKKRKELKGQEARSSKLEVEGTARNPATAGKRGSKGEGDGRVAGIIVNGKLQKGER
ncbi:MAG: hypothetical protein EA361_04990 [Bacteroidetes bacterium]|nr:MAG: hypothetical protein EA361_04990 [Bacteroidota bacterium]